MSPEPLSSVLRSAKPSWTERDLNAAESKLFRVGISSSEELAAALAVDTVNKRIQAEGLRAFSQDTLEAMKKRLRVGTAEVDEGRQAPPQRQATDLQQPPVVQEEVPTTMASLQEKYSDGAVPPLEEILAALDQEATLDSGKGTEAEAIAALPLPTVPPANAGKETQPQRTAGLHQDREEDEADDSAPSLSARLAAQNAGPQSRATSSGGLLQTKATFGVADPKAAMWRRNATGPTRKAFSWRQPDKSGAPVLEAYRGPMPGGAFAAFRESGRAGMLRQPFQTEVEEEEQARENDREADKEDRSRGTAAAAAGNGGYPLSEHVGGSSSSQPAADQSSSSSAKPAPQRALQDMALKQRRVIILRHGSRPDAPADPSLDSVGHDQAASVAAYLAEELKARVGTPGEVVAIFSSPFLRALQTAAPIAEALGLPIFVEWGFSELLAHGWLHSENPLPCLAFHTPEKLPMQRQIDLSYRTVVMPDYPDLEGAPIPGDQASRSRALKRHGDAARAALRKVRGSSVLIVAHGSTHDFVTGALCGSRHPRRFHTPACVPHCGITELVEEATAGNEDVASEEEQWRILKWGSRPWLRYGAKARAGQGGGGAAPQARSLPGSSQSQMFARQQMLAAQRRPPLRLPWANQRKVQASSAWSAPAETATISSENNSAEAKDAA